MFSFGQSSLTAMFGVHPDLLRVNRRAISITTQDFGCTCGCRSDSAQLDAWLHHYSKLNGIAVGMTVKGIHGTGRGNHQPSLKDHLGHAVDNTPYVDVDGKSVILWSAYPLTDLKGDTIAGNGEKQWQCIYPVAEAMRAAAIAENVKVRWGGVWDRALNDLKPGAAGLEAELKAYEARHAGPDFIDGPHFELVE